MPPCTRGFEKYKKDEIHTKRHFLVHYHVDFFNVRYCIYEIHAVGRTPYQSERPNVYFLNSKSYGTGHQRGGGAITATKAHKNTTLVQLREHNRFFPSDLG